MTEHVPGYRDAIKAAMNTLATDPKVVFVGYNVRHGRAGGSLADIAEERLIEMPVAENLMAGVAIGLSLRGCRPVLFFERCDFLLNALDQIVNHLDKIDGLSDGQFRPVVIIRVVVGNRYHPLYTGAPHIQDFGEAIRKMVSFPVFPLNTVADVRNLYGAALASPRNNVMLIEHKDSY